MKKSMYKIACELARKYEERGIKYVYNTSNRNVYLSILAAPIFVPDTEERQIPQMVGYLMIEGGKMSAVERTKDIDGMIDAVKQQYALQWKDNKVMMSYLDTVH